ncbi:septum formation initiator family protein [Rhodococcus sp. ABRD24]|uniref:FtsB family cell division protein n=1 Tax=Rhodococcus sp. ABRD24 TaxID=2507582 RepID=UPI001039608B|nr:septum formation initiator family protein [Rhodococcus sp. ABRD24]QBJ97643.1 septum formation initiator family protein [Rhodococcus sp. ABRD24]
MNQRGRSRSGRPSPGGRPERRSDGTGQGPHRPRRARSGAPAAPTGSSDSTAPETPGADAAVDGATRAARTRPSRVGARRVAPPERPERTFFGLSTGRAVILAVVICALALTLAMPLRTYLTQRAEADRLASERVSLENELKALQIQKQQIEDPAWIDAQARERLGLVKPGETPYKVQLPGDYKPPVKDAPPPPPSTGAWHSDLWQRMTQPLPVAEPEPATPETRTVPAPAPREPGVPTG